MSYVTDCFDDQVIELLKRGGVGFMPSDTIYGLSCRALDEQAVKKLRQIKQRDNSKAFIVLIASTGQLAELGVRWQASKRLIDKYWPGALTIVMPAPSAPSWLGHSLGNLAVRLPAHRALTKLIKQVGPIVSTSANPGGAEPAKNLAQARAYFGDELDFYVDAGQIKNTTASTLIRLSRGQFEVLRPGALVIDQKEFNFLTNP